MWEEAAADTVPAPFPRVSACVVRGPMIPTLMPSRLRFACLGDERGLRPMSQRLSAEFGEWFSQAGLARSEKDPAEVARLLAGELAVGEVLIAEVTAGGAERRFSHYSGWKPDYSWDVWSEWKTRLRLDAGPGGIETHGRLLGEVVEWLSIVPEYRASYRSVLVACPEVDVTKGSWWDYATGVRGSPMPILELGSMPRADELFWTSGASESRAPTLRELNTTKSHAFAVDDGPAGFVQVADSSGVRWGSEFLDYLSDDRVASQEAVLSGEDWADIEAAIGRLRTLAPAMRRFYNRAYQRGFWVVHFAFVDRVPGDITEVAFTGL